MDKIIFAKNMNLLRLVIRAFISFVHYIKADQIFKTYKQRLSSKFLNMRSLSEKVDLKGKP